jgi:DNA-directed RNA polymerase sigma subunit (sigma70/sigma32)
MADEMTLQAIADQMGFSRQRAEQIIRGALGKFKRAMYKRGITEFAHLSIDDVPVAGVRSGKRPRE